MEYRQKRRDIQKTQAAEVICVGVGDKMISTGKKSFTAGEQLQQIVILLLCPPIIIIIFGTVRLAQTQGWKSPTQSGQVKRKRKTHRLWVVNQIEKNSAKAKQKVKDKTRWIMVCVAQQ